MKDRIQVAYASPANIAFIKYWGKKGDQLPANPSFSMTLSHAVTQMRVEALRGVRSLSLRYDGQSLPAFEKRIALALDRMVDIFPWIQTTALSIDTHNSFPHSAGIASSASSMSALALCLSAIDRNGEANLTDVAFRKTASRVARLGSGSACRSLFGPWVVWDEGAIDAHPYEGRVHPMYEGLGDTILLVDRSPKSVSSREGHARMDSHPFAHAKYESARESWSRLQGALATGDWDAFTSVLEFEAMSLHAMMFTSTPSVCLWHPHTLTLLKRIQEWRHAEHVPVAITMDAGPNIHLIYPKECRSRVECAIQTEWIEFLDEGGWIADCAGSGPSEWNG